MTLGERFIFRSTTFPWHRRQFHFSVQRICLREIQQHGQYSITFHNDHVFSLHLLQKTASALPHMHVVNISLPSTPTFQRATCQSNKPPVNSQL